MLHTPLRFSFGKVTKLLTSILTFIFSGMNARAQPKFTEGVIIFKVDSIILDKPKDSIDITLSEIRLFKKHNLGRVEIITVEPKYPENFNTFTEIINEKGKYFIIDPHLGGFVKKMAVLLTIDDIKKGRAELAIKGKIRDFNFKRSAQKNILLKIPVEKVYRIEKDINKILELAAVLSSFNKN